MGNTPRVIIHLLIINVIFFFGSKVSGAISNDFLALHYFENDKFVISQLFTHLFMHGNEAHLFFNMFGLWMFGSTLANIWGTNNKKFEGLDLKTKYKINKNLVLENIILVSTEEINFSSLILDKTTFSLKLTYNF